MFFNKLLIGLNEAEVIKIDTKTCVGLIGF